MGTPVKRSLDVAFSFLALLLASPIFLIAALAVWLDSGLPILFRQERVGLGFERFHVLKFRTMSNEGSGPMVTVRGDRRVTRVGRILRLTKVDELPQFWNVLRGDMSVVGPRPEVPRYVELFKERYKTILSIRPGITDFASIVYRDEESVLARSEDPVRAYTDQVLPRKLDLADKYVREGNILIDLYLIASTAIATIRPGGSRTVPDFQTVEPARGSSDDRTG